MRKKRFAAIFSLAVLLVCIGLANAYAKPVIKDIRFESLSTTADRIIFDLNGPHLPTGKALPGDNPRVYFDFFNTTPANKVKTRLPTNGNFVKQIRYAYHKGAKSKTRVVFDLVANQKMEFKQDFDEDTNTLVITLFLAGTQPESVAVAPPSEPAAIVVEKPAQLETPVEDMGKKVQPMDEVSLAVVEKTEEVALPKPEPEPVPAPEPAPEPEEVTISEPEPMPEPEPIEEVKAPQVASIPPLAKVSDSLDTPIDEATVIQPMSEVGIQEEESVEDVAPVLHSIEFDPKSNRGEMISFKLNGFHPPVVFGIEEDIPRIVCFFKNTGAGDELRDMIGTNGKYVKNIKIGKYKNPDNVRVVLELVPGNHYDLQQVFFKDDKIFMMIINKAGKQISTQNN